MRSDSRFGVPLLPFLLPRANRPQPISKAFDITVDKREDPTPYRDHKGKIRELSLDSPLDPRVSAPIFDHSFVSLLPLTSFLPSIRSCHPTAHISWTWSVSWQLVATTPFALLRYIVTPTRAPRGPRSNDVLNQSAYTLGRGLPRIARDADRNAWNSFDDARCRGFTSI